jgi:hypothetical protein
MHTFYRIARGALAAIALVGLILFAAWHALLWRMGEVYIAEGGVTKNHPIPRRRT